VDEGKDKGAGTLPPHTRARPLTPRHDRREIRGSAAARKAAQEIPRDRPSRAETDLIRRTLAAGCIALTALLALVALTAGCGRNRRTEITELKSAIEAANARFAEAFSRRDVAALGALYAVDAQAFPPGTAPVAGRAAIQDMWKGLLAMPVGRIQLRTIEVDGNGETAWEEGRYTLVGSNGSTMDDGKYIVVWKHDADGLKLYRNMWSSNSRSGPPRRSAHPRPGSQPKVHSR